VCVCVVCVCMCLCMWVCVLITVMTRIATFVYDKHIYIFFKSSITLSVTDNQQALITISLRTLGKRNQMSRTKQLEENVTVTFRCHVWARALVADEQGDRMNSGDICI